MMSVIFWFGAFYKNSDYWGCWLIPDPAGKANLLIPNFDVKEWRNQVSLSLNCYVKFAFPPFAFPPFCKWIAQTYIFPLLPKSVSDVITPKLSALFRITLKAGSFPACWRSANIILVSMGPFRHRWKITVSSPLPVRHRRLLNDLLQFAWVDF